MRKLIILAASIAALAIPAAGIASVAVDANGVGFVGKGDVQTALGYKNNNDFTDAAARSGYRSASRSAGVEDSRVGDARRLRGRARDRRGVWDHRHR